MEILWPEAGDTIPVLLGLSHLFSNVDGGEDEKLERHTKSMEELGIQVAVIRNGRLDYETEPGSAQALIDASYQAAPGEGNVMRWDESGLVYRYVSRDQASIAVAMGPVPFRIGEGFFPPHMGLIWQAAGWGIFLLAAIIIILAGTFLVRRMSRDIIQPLTDLQRSAHRIGQGDYDTPVQSHGTDELGETAAVFEDMRRQLQAGRKLREQYEKNRQELFAGIAHDLATPLTKIQGYTGGILDGIANTPEKQQHYLELVYHTSKDMESMVHELFLLSKLELGKIAFHWENADLVPILQQYVSLQAETLRDQGFSLSFVNETGKESARVQLDRIQFQRVLDNLLSNAIKYRGACAGSLTFRLQERDGGYLLEGEDRGRGVAKEDLGRILNRFIARIRREPVWRRAAASGWPSRRRSSRRWAGASGPARPCRMAFASACGFPRRTRRKNTRHRSERREERMSIMKKSSSWRMIVRSQSWSGIIWKHLILK